MRGFVRGGLSVLLAGVLLVGQPASEASDAARAGARYERRSRRLAPGLRLIKILDRVGPNRIKVLKLNPDSALTLDVELAQDRLPGRETTSSMARRRGAIAATNGTFGLPWGRPIGLFAEDTQLQASPLVWGNALGLTGDQNDLPLGHPRLDVIVSDPLVGNLFKVFNWNEEETAPRRVSGYTPAGAPRVVTPSDACAARLVQVGSPRWAIEGTGIARTYEVDAVRCAAEPLETNEGMVLAAARRTPGARRIKSLEQGSLLDLTWSTGWEGVVDAIAGNPLVVSEGSNIGYDCDAPFCGRTARTGVGITGRGRILLVTVDGGRPGHSVGMTLRELGRLFVYLGADRALNLDGGGSTTMVAGGNVINRPKAGFERAVSSSLLILPGSDEEEPVVGAQSPATASGTEQSTGGLALLSDPAVTDPGSTGGLLDSLERGDLGRRVDLPAQLHRIARLFRAGRGGS